MINVLHGQVLHSYYLKIEVESPDGILETQVRPLVSFTICLQCVVKKSWRRLLKMFSSKFVHKRHLITK